MPVVVGGDDGGRLLDPPLVFDLGRHQVDVAVEAVGERDVAVPVGLFVDLGSDKDDVAAAFLPELRPQRLDAFHFVFGNGIEDDYRLREETNLKGIDPVSGLPDRAARKVGEVLLD